MKKNIFFFSLLLLVSCGSQKVILSKPHYPDTQIEAGDVYVSMHPPIQWYDIVDDLKPNFTLSSANEFLDDVLQITSKENQFSQNKRSFGLVANLPTNSNITTNTSTLNSEENGSDYELTNSSQNIESITTRSSGSVPNIQQPTADALFVEGQLSAVNSEMSKDPFLQYRAATALYQEIQLLNRYLDAQVATNGTIPYLFRTQISVQPYARLTSADIYSEIFVQPTDSFIETELSKESNELPNNWSECSQGIKVLPLVVVDNLERSNARRLESAVKQLYFTLSGMAGSAGLGALSENIKEQLKDIQALDLNSITTIAKSDNDEITVRIGATRSSSGYSMVARSYDISFIVLWPKVCGLNGVLRQSYSMYRTDNGERIPLFNKNYQKRFKAHLIRLSNTRGLKKEDQEKFADCVIKAVSDQNNTFATCGYYDRDSGYAKTMAFRILKKFGMDSDSELFNLIKSYLKSTKVQDDEFVLPTRNYKAPPPQVVMMNDPGSGSAELIVGGAKYFGTANNITGKVIFSDVSYFGPDNKFNIDASTDTKLRNQFESANYDFPILVSTDVKINNEGMMKITIPSPTSLGKRNEVLENKAYLVVDRVPFPHESDTESERFAGKTNTNIRGVYPILLNLKIGDTPMPVLHEFKILPVSPGVEGKKTKFTLTVNPKACPKNIVCPDSLMASIDKYKVEILDYPIEGVKLNNTIDHVHDMASNSFLAEKNKAYTVYLDSISSGSKFKVKVIAVNTNSKPIPNQVLSPVQFSVK